MRVVHSLALALAVAFLTMSGLSAASAAEAALRKPTNIPPQALRPALHLLSRERDFQVVFRTDVVADLKTQGASGELTVEEALTKLLAGTGLTYRYLDDRTVTILPQALAAMPAASAASGSLSMGGQPLSPEGEGKGVRVAQVQSQERAEGEVAESRDGEDAEDHEADEERGGIPEILVTGSKLGTLNMDIRRSKDDIQPYVIIDRSAIERSGATSIRELLTRQLPMIASPSTNGGINGSSTAFNLRGLGTDQTLVLVDGRRVPSVGFSGNPQQPSLNGIPLSAVDRIEVLPTTASGIYGGSATGGVINVILKRDYSGLSVELTYGSTFEGGGDEQRVDLSGGFALADGNTYMMFTGSHAEGDSLQLYERDEFLRRAREHILTNNPEAILGNASPPLGQTTNIRSTSGNLTLKSNGAPLNSPITFVPKGYSGVSSDGGAALVTNAGQYNLDLANTAQSNGGGRATLASVPKTFSASATVRHTFTPYFEAFLDFSAAETTSRTNSNAANTTFQIPSTAASNPFNQSIRITTPAFGADGETATEVKSKKATAGVIARLPRDWRAELDYTWGQSRFSASISSGLSSDAFAVVRSGAIDVLRDTEAFPISFADFTIPPSQYDPVDSTMQDTAVRLGGPVWELPAAAVTASVRLEHETHALGDQVIASGNTSYRFYPDRTQTVDAAHIELTVPLVSLRNRLRGVEELELQLANRWDKYQTEGVNVIESPQPGVPLREPVTRVENKFTSSNPTIGFRYKPLKDLMLRASYGTGFLPPSTTQLVPGAPFVLPSSAFVFFSLTDPLRGGEPIGSLGDVTQLTGGNPDLRPEESESRSVGLIWKPVFIPGLRTSLDWVMIDKTNNIQSLFNFQQNDLHLEGIVPGFITRGPLQPGDSHAVGPIVQIDSRLVNVAEQRIEAYDIALDYQWRTQSVGAFSITANGTRQIHNATQAVPIAPIEEAVGLIGSLKWNVNARIACEYDQLTLAWTTRYLDSYWLNADHSVNQSQGAAKIDSQTYHDLFARYHFENQARGSRSVLANTEIRIGIKNLLGKDPPLSANSYPFYSLWGDPRVTSYYLTLKKDFN